MVTWIFFRKTGPCGTLSLPLTYVAVVHPDALPVVPAPALHHVVRIIGFSNFIVRVDDNLGSDGETQHEVI